MDEKTCATCAKKENCRYWRLTDDDYCDEYQATEPAVSAPELTRGGLAYLWKLAAKKYRRTANAHADRLVTAMERLLSLDAALKEARTEIAKLQWDYDEAMQQYDAQQKRACEAEAKLNAALVEAKSMCHGCKECLGERVCYMWGVLEVLDGDTQ